MSSEDFEPTIGITSLFRIRRCICKLMVHIPRTQPLCDKLDKTRAANVRLEN